MKRFSIFYFIVGVVCIFLGLIGLFLPFLQGIALLVAGWYFLTNHAFERKEKK